MGAVGASGRKDSTLRWGQETAALRDFNPGYDCLGSKCEDLALSICCPLCPLFSDQRADILDGLKSAMSRLMGRSKTASLGAIRRRVPPKPLGLGGA